MTDEYLLREVPRFYARASGSHPALTADGPYAYISQRMVTAENVGQAATEADLRRVLEEFASLFQTEEPFEAAYLRELTETHCKKRVTITPDGFKLDSLQPGYYAPLSYPGAGLASAGEAVATTVRPNVVVRLVRVLRTVWRLLSSTLRSRYVRWAAFVAAIGGGIYAANWLYHNFRRLRNDLLMRGRVGGTRRIRGAFCAAPFAELKSHGNHSHGAEAAARNAAVLHTRDVAAQMGRIPFMTETSPQMQRDGVEGSRDLHWAKDLGATPSDSVHGPGHALCMIDVDYYHDMNAHLCTGDMVPVLIYTIMPQVVSRSTAAASHKFVDATTFSMSVNGGATYEHELWDYSSDTLVATSGMTARVYNVDVKRTGLDRAIVCLSPLAEYTGLVDFLIWRVFRLSCSPLERMCVASPNPEFACIDVMTSGGIIRSVGKYNSYMSVELPATTWDSFDSVQANMGTIKPSSLSNFARGNEEEFTPGEIRARSHLLTHYVNGVVGATDVKPQFFGVSPVSNYTFYPYGRDSGYESPSPSLRVLCTPFVAEATAVPTFCPANERASIHRRVLELQAGTRVFETNQSKELVAKAFMSKLQREFAELLIPTVHQGYPCEVSVVYERQNRPTQVRILEEAEGFEGGAFPDVDSFIEPIRVFMKKEAYQEVGKDPRNISTVPGSMKREWSRYMYSFSEVLKALPCYAFSKTPREIEEQVAKVASSALKLTNADASRMDGRVSQVVRDVERAILLRFFATEFHDELEEIRRTQYNASGVGRFGMKYQTGTSRLSGSPETSALNTVLTMFVVYCAHRRTKVDGEFIQPEKAFDLVVNHSMVGGDDALVADVDSHRYTVAGNSVGQLMKLVEVHRYHGGAEFLSRIYSQDVWTGSTVNCCDILRMCSKLHLSKRGDVSQWDKLVTKAYSVYLTDSTTPVIGDICELILETQARMDDTSIHVVAGAIDNRKLERWWAHYAEDVQYTSGHVDSAWTSFCDATGWNNARFEHWIDAVRRMAPVDAVENIIYGNHSFGNTEDDMTNMHDMEVNGDVWPGTAGPLQDPGDVRVRITEVRRRAGKNTAGVEVVDPGTESSSYVTAEEQTQKTAPETTGKTNNAKVKRPAGKRRAKALRGAADKSRARRRRRHERGQRGKPRK
jgi:hypothetical protein